VEGCGSDTDNFFDNHVDTDVNRASAPTTATVVTFTTNVSN